MQKEPEQTGEAATPLSETEKLNLENETLKRLLKSKEEAIGGLEKTISGRDSEIAAIKQVAEDFKQKFDQTDKALEAAIKAYLTLAAEANPGPVAGMIKGETIEAVNESLKSAKTLVEKVKQEVGAENARVRVPAGAPQRTLPDLSALSAREKIKYAMERG